MYVSCLCFPESCLSISRAFSCLMGLVFLMGLGLKWLSFLVRLGCSLTTDEDFVQSSGASRVRGVVHGLLCCVMAFGTVRLSCGFAGISRKIQGEGLDCLS